MLDQLVALGEEVARVAEEKDAMTDDASHPVTILM